MTFTTIQSGFGAGEISPSLFGRNDLAKWHQGAFTMRNAFVNYRGGAASRPGTAYVGMCKQGAPNIGGTATANPPKDITFQFSVSQGYALEFGDAYMRIKSNGAYVLEPAVAVASVSTVALFTTSAAHGYHVGDWVFAQNITGFSGLTWIVATVPNSTTFTVTDLFGTTISAATASTGGTVARLYTVTTPYAAVDLPYLKATQSADVMTLTCVNQATRTEYPAYELERLAATNWTLTPDTIGTTTAAPVNVSGTAQSSTAANTYYSYVVTAIDATTGQESVASAPVSIYNNNIAIYAGSNTVTWSPVTNASSYNVYKATPAFQQPVPIGTLYGYCGTVQGPSFTDGNITADFTQTPPQYQNPFARGQIAYVNVTANGSGYTQGATGYAITTSTGSGAVLTPVVLNGAVIDVIVQNGGANYAPSDTITITGGGATYATGSITFSTNPNSGDTITMNGVVFTFETTISGANQIPIGGTLAATMQAAAGTLEASTNASVDVANYTNNATLIYITYKTPGSSGTSYTLAASVATVSGPTLTIASGGGGATATLTLGAATGTYPGRAAYFQQRKVYAESLSGPDTYWMSKPGAFSNYDVSTPIVDDDAITGTPWAQQVNGIQALVPMPGGLVVLTGKGAWQVNGGNAAAITPANEDATPQAYNGCNPIVDPIVVNYDIIYLQEKGSIFRDLSYNFFVNIYTGTDLTVLSNHLFFDHTFMQAAWAEEPYKLVWTVRDDGAMLTLTYLKEQDVYAWARHDTNGLFVGVCTVIEPPVDAVYVIVKRFVRGSWVYYAERMDNRSWTTPETCWCADAGLAYPMQYPAATLTAAAANGSANITSVLMIAGGSGYTAPVASAVDPSGQGTGATFTVTVASGAITSITPVASGTNYQPGTQIVITDATGSGAVAQPVITNIVTFSASTSVFSSGDVGDVIRVGGGKATITSFVSTTEVMANVTSPIMQTVPNDPNNTPVPQLSGAWSKSTPTATVTGINHLEGLQVSIVADGSVVPSQTVTDGTITLPHAASQILVGLPFTVQLQSVYLDPAGPITSQTKRKNIQAVGLRVESSRGWSVGTNQVDASTQPNTIAAKWSGMIEVKERNATIDAGADIPLYTGDVFTSVPASWATAGQIAVEQSYPMPLNVLAAVAYYNLGDTSG